eukprot:3642211-Rhodomonas_salina.2
MAVWVRDSTCNAGSARSQKCTNRNLLSFTKVPSFRVQCKPRPPTRSSHHVFTGIHCPTKGQGPRTFLIVIVIAIRSSNLPVTLPGQVAIHVTGGLCFGSGLTVPNPSRHTRTATVTYTAAAGAAGGPGLKAALIAGSFNLPLPAGSLFRVQCQPECLRWRVSKSTQGPSETDFYYPECFIDPDSRPEALNDIQSTPGPPESAGPGPGPGPGQDAGHHCQWLKLLIRPG